MGGKLYMLHVIDVTTRVVSLVDMEAWVWAIDFVKKQYLMWQV
jgi:hypothetical protein